MEGPNGPAPIAGPFGPIIEIGATHHAYGKLGEQRTQNIAKQQLRHRQQKKGHLKFQAGMTDPCHRIFDIFFDFNGLSSRSLSTNCVEARKVFTRLIITKVSNVAMMKSPKKIPPDDNYGKTVNDTHDGTQDDQSCHKLSECSRLNKKEVNHSEQLLTDERKS
jgi:hypothetical protein